MNRGREIVCVCAADGSTKEETLLLSLVFTAQHCARSSFIAAYTLQVFFSCCPLLFVYFHGLGKFIFPEIQTGPNVSVCVCVCSTFLISLMKVSTRCLTCGALAENRISFSLVRLNSSMFSDGMVTNRMSA